MRLFRIVIFLLAGVGLTVQAAAYAAAPAVLQGKAATHCAGMAMVGQGLMQEQGNPCTPCKDMSLSCLVSMNCLPLFLPSPSVAEPAAFKVSGDSFTSMPVAPPSGRSLGPLPPPPKSNL